MRQGLSGRLPCIQYQIFDTALQPENPNPQERIAARVLHLPLRLALKRESDRRSSGQLARDDSPALQGVGHESRRGKMVQCGPVEYNEQPAQIIIPTE